MRSTNLVSAALLKNWAEKLSRKCCADRAPGQRSLGERPWAQPGRCEPWVVSQKAQELVLLTSGKPGNPLLWLLQL